ncbi:hypothetical protein V1520DRAFT_284942 [Lipomyces starkeyi]|uniref:Uncharacterized protein n=1 Tax=Lipomyces starkeyi NRRL Y-11557 TaxID=675824 RepID=A0A1E3Q6Q0_LIPST|nr:hypothetical protein LIPSTDRAFT_3699 [Lipomyces starkeyi NRRL Y-11557]
MADISEKFDSMSIQDQGNEQSWGGAERRTYVPPHARKFFLPPSTVTAPSADNGGRTKRKRGRLRDEAGTEQALIEQLGDTVVLEVSYGYQAGIIAQALVMTRFKSDFSRIVSSPGVRSDDDGRQEETFAQTRKILEMRSSSDVGSFGAFSCCDNTPSALFNRLRALPSRMAETFVKPESARDVLATLSAIAALVECCDTSFESDEVGAAWRGITTWLTKVPDHFNHMVSRHNQPPSWC